MQMKKLLLSLVCLLSIINLVLAQTTAANFTATDCNSTSHTLHTVLANGKVIVLVWIMPCLTCISDAKGAYDAVQAFASSHPGQVLYYLIDDNGNTSCGTLNSWANTNAIGSNRTVFDNAGAAINENNYGGSGMPHVMVIGGGTAHTVFFNQLNGSNNGPAIQSAITQALAATNVSNVNSVTAPVSVYPNPTHNDITVSYSLGHTSDVSIEVVNITGSVVKSLQYDKQSAGIHDTRIDLGSISNGIYLVKVHSDNGTASTKFTLAK